MLRLNTINCGHSKNSSLPEKLECDEKCPSEVDRGLHASRWMS